MLGKVAKMKAEAARHRIEARDEQQYAYADDLRIGKRALIHLGLDGERDEIIRRISTASAYQLLQIGGYLPDGVGARLLVAHDARFPGEEPAHALLGKPHEVEEYADWKRLGKILDEVASTLVG